EQFVIPLRGSREFGLERAGVARLLSIAQLVDLLALLPVGRLADRWGTRPVLVVVLLAFGAALGLVAFGSLPLMVGGCVLFGLGMAGWMLPLGLLRSVTPVSRVAWRTALYRVGVDGGLFLGPFLSGLLAARASWLLPAVMTLVLVALALALGARGRGAPAS
ncbi:MAG TPA: MFS transporter, partial [Candidatus Tectomicrobia bacterium]|nr:MFS transporter [Candidatus Tectomicrobia bacterium]